MPNVDVSIPHQLSRPEARQRVEALITDLRSQFGNLGQFKETWNGDTMDFAASGMGVSVTGQVFVEDARVRLLVALPWHLAMLAGRVKQRIQEEGQKLLSHR